MCVRALWHFVCERTTETTAPADLFFFVSNISIVFDQRLTGGQKIVQAAAAAF